MAKESIKLKLEQINFTVGDLDGNCAQIIAAYKKCQNEVDLVIFSELAITGYPPEDLLQKPYFIQTCAKKITELAQITKSSKCAILLGAPHQDQDLLYNSAFLLEDGKIKSIINKVTLPNYCVFDEKRHFAAAKLPTTINFHGFNLAILICEDIWDEKNSLALQGKNIDAVISINASPFSLNKAEKRLEIAKKFISNLNKPLIYVNQIGGQDSLIFDGASFAMNGNGEVVLQMKEFEEDSVIISLCHSRESGNPDILEVKLDSRQSYFLRGNDKNTNNELGKIYNATILGLRDYITKNGFSKVLIGMSGGIDSALVAAIAVDALSSGNVKLVALPSRYNSTQSFEDANNCSKNLGIKLGKIEIEPAFQALLGSLSEEFSGTKPDLTEENIQSRIRGNILMALSNKFGNLLLSTGNKSELSVGYATIYGDMCGAYNPIKDIYKTDVFKLCRWRNDNIPQISVYKKTDLIPENIITKAPSAELRPDQKDSDSLPEYDILDKILYQLIEEEKSLEEIIQSGFDEMLVKKIARLFYNSEYKRRQSVIGPKLSIMPFDKSRRYPITNKFCS